MFADWWHKGADFDVLPRIGDSSIIHITQKRVLVFEDGGYFDIVNEPYFATGSGGALARVAMECGKNAYEAVEIVCKFDAWSGGPVHHMRLR